MTTSQDWWPADYGHYGPLFIRMSWHAAGTYRIADGRGGGGERRAALRPAQQLARQREPRQGAPAALAGQAEVRPEDLVGRPDRLRRQLRAGVDGVQDVRLRLRAPDVWEPDEVFWGPEDTWLGDERYSGERDLANPLGAVQMGLIYVNPEGPNGNPDPLAAARDIRETFARMAMNDEETVALIVGGHTFGKCHGAGDPDSVGPEPEGCPVEAQGIGWKSTAGTGMGADTITSGLEGAWTNKPTTWDNGFLDNLFGYDWELTTSPAGAKQWTPTNPEAAGHGARRARSVEAARADDADDRPRAAGRPDLRAHLEALPREPGRARRRVRQGVVQAAAPRHGTALALPRPVGPGAAAVAGPGPRGRPRRDRRRDDIAALKRTILASGLSISQLVSTAWASAASFRGTDKRGGANGARIRLAPQKDWAVNDPSELAKVLQTLEGIQQDFNALSPAATKVSLADLIVLGGCAAVEQAAKDAGARRHGAVRAGAHRRLAGADRRRVVRGARTDGRRVPQLPPSRTRSCRRRRCCSTGPTC